jgi:hypothetical protein
VIVSSNSLTALIIPTHLATRSSGITIPSVIPHKIKQKHKKDVNIPSPPQVHNSATPGTKTDTEYNDIHNKMNSHESNTSHEVILTCSPNSQENISPMLQAYTPMGAHPSLELPDVKTAHQHDIFPQHLKEATEIDIFFGDDHRTKLPLQFRFVFNNKNGLVLTHTDMINFTAITKELQSDWVGIVETHVASNKPHIRDSILSALKSKQGYPNLNAVFSSSDLNVPGDRNWRRPSVHGQLSGLSDNHKTL